MEEDEAMYSDYPMKRSNEYNHEYIDINYSVNENYNDKIINEMLLTHENNQIYESDNKNYVMNDQDVFMNDTKPANYECENEYKLLELGRVGPSYYGCGLLPGQSVCSNYVQHPYPIRQRDFYPQEYDYYVQQPVAPWQDEDLSRCSVPMQTPTSTSVRSSEESPVTPSSSTGKFVVVYVHREFKRKNFFEVMINLEDVLRISRFRFYFDGIKTCIRLIMIQNGNFPYRKGRLGIDTWKHG